MRPSGEEAQDTHLLTRGALKYGNVPTCLRAGFGNTADTGVGRYAWSHTLTRPGGGVPGRVRCAPYRRHWPVGAPALHQWHLPFINGTSLHQWHLPSINGRWGRLPSILTQGSGVAARAASAWSRPAPVEFAGQQTVSSTKNTLL